MEGQTDIEEVRIYILCQVCVTDVNSLATWMQCVHWHSTPRNYVLQLAAMTAQ